MTVWLCNGDVMPTKINMDELGCFGINEDVLYMTVAQANDVAH